MAHALSQYGVHRRRRQRWRLSYFGASRPLTAVVDGHSFPTTNDYDPDGRMSMSVDPDGFTGLDAYDPAGNVTKTVDADNHSVLTSFDGAGLATKVVDGDGYTTLSQYDADNRMTALVDGDNHTSLTAYDKDDNVTLTTDGAGVTAQTAFDPDNNVTKTVVNGYTTTIQFDKDNNQTASVDGNGATTAQAFDLADQLTKVTDPDTNVTSYGLDGDGFATLVTNPNGYTTQQKFDGNGAITQQITPDGNTISYTYDGDGRLTADGNGNRTYNAEGLLATAYNANGTYVFSYDKDDRLTLVTEPYSQSLNYAYDPGGNQTQVIDSLGGTLSSTYDSDNYLTRRTYTGLGPSERFDFINNKEGWNTTLTSYSDLAGATLVATSKYGYDGAGNVTSVLSSDHTGATIDQFTYALDGNGNVTSETDTQAGTTTTTSYGYDSAGQLTSAGTGTYGYDAAGNRDTGGNTVTTGNEMESDGTYDYSYDDTGNETYKVNGTSGLTWEYGYNSVDELTSAREFASDPRIPGTGDPALVEVDYNYDAFGEMIQRTDGSLVSRFCQDGWNSNMPAATGNANMNVWAVLNGSNAWQERDLWGDAVDQGLGRIMEGSTNYGLYSLLDRQQSVRDVIDATGTVQADIIYLWKWQPQTDRNSDSCGSGPPRAGRYNRHFRGLLPGQRAQARSQWCSPLPAPPAGRYPTHAWRNGVRHCGDATGLGIARPTVYRWQRRPGPAGQGRRPSIGHQSHASENPAAGCGVAWQDAWGASALGTGPRGRWARTCGCFSEST